MTPKEIKDGLAGHSHIYPQWGGLTMGALEYIAVLEQENRTNEDTLILIEKGHTLLKRASRELLAASSRVLPSQRDQDDYEKISNEIEEFLRLPINQKK